MRKLSVWYIGEDKDYWEKLKGALSEFDEFEFSYDHLKVGSKFEPDKAFVTLYEEQADIIYVDLSESSEKTLSLCKLLCRNNVTRLKSTVGLHSSCWAYVRYYGSGSCGGEAKL